MEWQNSDSARLALLQKAKDIILTVPQDQSYPTKEITWLVTQAWNRGCHAVKFSRYTDAVSYMDAAVSLLRFCPDLEQCSQVSML